MQPYRQTIEIDIDAALNDRIDEIGTRLFSQKPNSLISKREVIEVLIKMGIESAENGYVEANRYTVSNIVPLNPYRLK